MVKRVTEISQEENDRLHNEEVAARRSRAFDDVTGPQPAPYPGWKPGERYTQGDCVSWDNKVWQANKNVITTLVPPSAHYGRWDEVTDTPPRPFKTHADFFLRLAEQEGRDALAAFDFDVVREAAGRLPTQAAARKAVPIVSGCLDYFPDALAAVAALSLIGNEQHNPGEPLHWARGKSSDEADCILRHLMDRGTFDTDGVRHSVKVAWRALAQLQKELEEAGGLPISRGSCPA